MKDKTKPNKNKWFVSLLLITNLICAYFPVNAAEAPALNNAIKSTHLDSDVNTDVSTDVSININAKTSAISAQALENTTLKNKVKKKPTIIALSPHIVEMLYDIGAGDQIIGTSEHSDFPEAAKNIPRIGNYIRLQLERVIELQPDVIIAWKSGSPSDDIERLIKLGFNVVYSEPKTFHDIADELEMFGFITNNKEKSKVVAQFFRQKLNKIKDKYQRKRPITVFYELWARPLTSIANGSWPQQHLTICSAKNPFYFSTIPYPQPSIEQVLQKPIQLIIQPISSNQKERETFNWQKWRSMPAVINNKIIHPDADALHRMSPRSLDELENLCEKIDQVRTFYHTKKR